MKYRVLVLGASYGSLFSTKLLMAGHQVTVVCTAPTASLINREGTCVSFPVRGREERVEIASRDLPGTLAAVTPGAADPGIFDLIVLGMQEAHYGSSGVRDLMRRIGRARKPCFAIMNMPPPPYLRRLRGLNVDTLEASYAEPAVWDGFDPRLVTLASPDPQAFRPPEAAKNFLQVGLPTNFKAARFEDEAATAILRQLEADIEEARHTVDGEAIEIPVKLKVHDSVFVPLAKWPMLIAGNYRCIRPQDMIPIRDAVHRDFAESRRIYGWVVDLCIELGAEPGDLVPFEKYAKAAESLGKPSSAARALFAGAKHIERVDSLVQRIARERGLHSETVERIVALVDARLAANRAPAEKMPAFEPVPNAA